MASVFQKFGGIRPMAAKIGEPVSTVNSWHTKGRIPKWRHDSILAAAARENIDLAEGELTTIAPDDPDQLQDAAA